MLEKNPVSLDVLTGSSVARDQPREFIESRNDEVAMVAVEVDTRRRWERYGYWRDDRRNR